MSADPVKEVKVSWEILKSLELRERGVKIVSCPTCARSEFNVIKIAKQVEKLTEQIKKPLKIAIMGCVVNGLGEAREADLGIIGIKNGVLLTKKGKKIKKIREKYILKEFDKLIQKP